MEERLEDPTRARRRTRQFHRLIRARKGAGKTLPQQIAPRRAKCWWLCSWCQCDLGSNNFDRKTPTNGIEAANNLSVRDERLELDAHSRVIATRVKIVSPAVTHGWEKQRPVDVAGKWRRRVVRAGISFVR